MIVKVNLTEKGEFLACGQYSLSVCETELIKPFISPKGMKMVGNKKIGNCEHMGLSTAISLV
jgi:hypothetical protein